MQDIRGYSTFKEIEPVNKGWSEDKKYYIETAAGENCSYVLQTYPNMKEKDRI